MVDGENHGLISLDYVPQKVLYTKVEERLSDAQSRRPVRDMEIVGHPTQSRIIIAFIGSILVGRARFLVKSCHIVLAMPLLRLEYIHPIPLRNNHSRQRTILLHNARAISLWHRKNRKSFC